MGMKLTAPQIALVVRALSQTISPAGRFGRGVFLSELYTAILAHSSGDLMSWESFASSLIEAHQEGLLILSRADLVTSMDVQTVESSEINYLTETFHLVEVG